MCKPLLDQKGGTLFPARSRANFLKWQSDVRKTRKEIIKIGRRFRGVGRNIPFFKIFSNTG